jgi:hypothetical protein
LACLAGARSCFEMETKLLPGAFGIAAGLSAEAFAQPSPAAAAFAVVGWAGAPGPRGLHLHARRFQYSRPPSQEHAAQPGEKGPR